MKTGWTKLGQIAEINPPVSRELDANEDVAFLPMAGVSEKGCLTDVSYRPANEVLKGYTAFQIGDILLAKITPCMENGKAAMASPISVKFGFGSTEFHVLRAKEGTDPRFLFHAVWNSRFRNEAAKNMTGSAGQKRVPKSFIERYEIVCPTLTEQKRLANILDQADAIRRKRQQALRLTDDFLRSVFLDMFGDPVTNPKGWREDILSHGVESFDGGWNIVPTDIERSDGCKVLKVSAVTSGEYRSDESKNFAEDISVPTDYVVRKGDLLISRANTAELVGAVAYVWDAVLPRMLPDKLWRFVWKHPRTLDPHFMLHLAKSKYFRDQLIQRATGSSGSMKNIGKSKMLEIPIPYPPIELQERFAKIVTNTHDVLIRARSATAEAEALFQALQHRAFTGQL